MSKGVTLPGADKRLAIVGSTGSGKTFAGVFHLSNADYHIRPWFVIDFKRDKLIGEIGGQYHRLGDRFPTDPGIYIIQPMPDDIPQLTEFLWECWRRERVGLYFDEGYMIGNRNPAFRALLTQGRSKQIQMITLSQRPAWMDRFVFSESDYFQVFRLNDRRDYDTIQAMISVDVRSRIPPYHSRWYDVGQDLGVTFAPVPDRAVILETFARRLPRQARVI